jgi:glyoxylase-like metal-dependent hydrolase (beta-lactamase superfamily II)
MRDQEFTVKKFVTGPIETNTYLLSNRENKCVVFDPSHGCGEIIAYIRDEKMTLEAVCLTHGHFDHFLGINEIIEAYPACPVWIHPDDIPLLRNPDYNGSYMLGMHLSHTGPVRELREGVQRIGSFEFTVFHIPGHSPGGVSYYIGGNCFCGDSLFAGSVGRVDFPGCDGDALLKNISEKLFTLPDETAVCPGHGGRTTIGREKQSNPFFR